MALALPASASEARPHMTFDQAGQKLTVRNQISSIEVGKAQLGFSVALSANGRTAILGGYGDKAETGAAWVFTRSGSRWRQGQKLTAKGESPKSLPGFGFGKFGYSVALSAKADTALISAFGVEAVWVFTRSGATWKQGQKLVKSKQGPQGPTLQEGFGVSVALSAAGNTALIGGSGDDNPSGAAYVFERSGSTWARQGRALIGTGAVGPPHLGDALALSGDGNTAAIGGPIDDGGKGAVWVFTRTGTAWKQQGSKLTATGERGPAQFGSSVALSADGNTAVVGGYEDDNGAGAAWVFTRSGSTWKQVQKLTIAKSESPSGLFGFRTAISSNGTIAVISGPGDMAGAGAAWVFTRSGSTWTRQGPKLTPTGAKGNASFGYGLALARDGRTALIGGPADNSGAGAAWVKVRRP